MSAAPEYGCEPPAEHDPPRSTLGPHTIEDWLKLDPAPDGSSIELITGYLFVTPPPGGTHQFAALNLGACLRAAIRAAERNDLFAVPGVGVRISTTMRTALIPDLVLLDRTPVGAVSFPAEAVRLAVEIWSPGNPVSEREIKVASYAGAGVPFFWAIDQPSKLNPLRLTAHRLENGLYKAENILEAEGPETITASPVPITLDLADLLR
ncbi:Uma2 family endonuclease [Saccharothrix mutabilis subsp. mutabilis]|uniref:Uma2 family endonuclease n=1 Tax=Saccharothrix mutabilis subsp. mutabilis TaxID=66855 RepID=A0ABN0U3D2_9PSEU